MSLFCQTHTGDDVFERLRQEWDTLDAETSPRRPYSSELWNRLWWAHFRRCNRLVRDELHLVTIRSAQNRLIAIAPMMVTHRPGWGPLTLRKLQFFGTPTSISEIRGPVCRSADQCEVVDALQQHFLANRATWDILRWDGLRAGTGDRIIASQGAALRSEAAFSDFILRMPACWDDLFAGLSKNRRNKLRRAYSRLRNSGFKPHLRAATTPLTAGPALSRLLGLYRRRIEADGSVLAKHSDRLGGPLGVRFLTALALAMAECGRLRLFELEIDGAVVASQIAYLNDSDIYLSYSGFDPRWAEYSVMTVLSAEILRWAIESGIARVNLSTGRDLDKLRWRPDEIGYEVVTLTQNHFSGRMLALAYDTTRRARSLALPLQAMRG